MGDKPNRLIHEKSPYLLQHAFNPVDWYPWGDEAFARAKAENKPVFLSVGYSTCHWCHVMEEESFENPQIAAILNRWFICIKVDREERPDIDQMYMSATQAMTGSGGWPMSVFLFPDGRAFYAGTYFPPQSVYGRPGFADLLQGIHEAWESRRPDLESVATELVEALEKQSRQGGTGDKLRRDVLDKAYREFAGSFDRELGGFGTPPKFPRPVQFNFLLRYWHRTGEMQARDMVLQTLGHMERGGIWDQLGGGYHRYATDRKWFVPHFEKMLYDQAQLANTYLDAFQITGEQSSADVAAGIFDYVLRDMTSPEGGFYSAEDADSEDPYNPGKKSEGAFYLWTEQEIRELLPAKDADIFIFRFGVEAAGNVSEDPQGEFKGRNILYQAHTIEETAEKLNKTVEDVSASLHNATKTLLARRGQRKRPHLDDKILVSWNGLMIGALARGAAVLQDTKLLTAAVDAATFIQKYLYNKQEGTLNRRYRDGEAGLPGQLDDYAFLVNGLFALYQAEQDPQWLQWAVNLTEKQIELFWDKEQGGFFDSVVDASLPIRMKGMYDGAEPAGNSIAALNLQFLGSVTMNREWLEKSAVCTELFSSAIMNQPTMLPEMLHAWDLGQAKPWQVIVVGPKGREDTRRMLDRVNSIYVPDKILLLLDNGKNRTYLTGSLPFIESLEMVNEKTTAYVCKDYTCQLPVTSPDEVQKQLVPTPVKTPLK